MFYTHATEFKQTKLYLTISNEHAFIFFTNKYQFMRYNTIAKTTLRAFCFYLLFMKGQHGTKENIILELCKNTHNLDTDS